MQMPLMQEPIIQEEPVQSISPLPENFNRAERTVELLSRFYYAESWRRQYDEKAVEWYKLFRGWREKVKGRSNLHIPRTYEQLDAIRARLVKSFFSTKPYLEFNPVPRDGTPVELATLNTEKAKVASALVDYQLDKNQIKSKFFDFITSLLIFPAGIMSVGWKLDYRKVALPTPQLTNLLEVAYNNAEPEFENVWQEYDEKVWDDNEIQVVDYFDFWPDPKGKDIDSCRFVFQREWLTEEQLIDRLVMLEEAGFGQAFPIDWEKVHGTSVQSEGRDERMSAVGLSPASDEGQWGEDQSGRIGKLYEVLHYWEDQRYALIVNRTELAYEGRSPYWKHGKKPYVVASYSPMPNEFYGMSAVEIIEHLQHELNTNRNQRIDNIALILNRMWLVRRGADIDDSELVSRPHGIIRVDDVERDVKEMAMNDVPRSTYVDEQTIKQDMENSLGVPGVVRGVDPSRAETATEVVTKSSNAGTRFDVGIMVLEDSVIERLAMLMDCNNQQFVDDVRAVQIFGEDTGPMWKSLSPGDLVGERDYAPSGANVDPAANKEIRRQQVTQIMSGALSTQNPYIDLYELTKMWVQSFDVRNVEKLLLPREQVDQMLQIQAQQAQEHEAVVAGRVPEQQQNAPPASPQEQMIQQMMGQGG